MAYSIVGTVGGVIFARLALAVDLSHSSFGTLRSIGMFDPAYIALIR